jgi:hypothetical protein
MLPAATMMSKNFASMPDQPAAGLPDRARAGGIGVVLRALSGHGLRAGLLAAVAALCACAAQTDGPAPAANSTAKLSDVFATPDWAKFTGTSKPLVQRAVTPNDLIAADGSCAGAPGPATAMAPATDGNAPDTTSEALQGQGGLPQVSGGIALAMTECEVVQRAGMPTEFQIGAEGQERVTTITYTQGMWPGLYRFRGGRLASIERVAVPEPVKPKKPAPRRPAQRS